LILADLFPFQFNNQGLIHEVFTTILRGLSGAKVTKPGKFRSCQDGYAVKSSLKAEDGILYPLEKSFFFLPKPPTLILHEEVKSDSTDMIKCQLLVHVANDICKMEVLIVLIFPIRLTMWSLRGMLLVDPMCIILTFLSD